MADTRTFKERGLTWQLGAMPAFKAISGAAISAARLLKFSSGKVVHATVGSTQVVGASGEQALSAANLPATVVYGVTILDSDCAISAGQRLKAGYIGKANVLIDAGTVGTTLGTVNAGSAFDQTGVAGDSVTALSSNAGDTTQSFTVIGTTNGTDTVVVETKALNGVNPVTTAKADWGIILAVKLSAVCAGTITFRETSGSNTITTVTTGNLSKGVTALSNKWAYNQAPTVESDAATTKQIGLKGTDSTGATIYDSQALNGTAAQTMNTAFNAVTEMYTGDIEAGRKGIVKVGAENDENLACGIALEDQAVAGDTFLAKVW